MRDVSALTIAAGREAHLHNVIEGFARQTQPPRELIIGVMQDHLYEDLPATPFPVQQIPVTRPDGELPLAAARNAVAEAARGEVLAFVDVDCIPHPSLVAEVAAVAEPGRGLVMGEVAYLPKGATEGGLDFDRFEELGVKHSDRQAPPAEGLKRCEDYRCFWSLNFAMHRDDWARAGGFDEGYFGYGAEDTDFGRVVAHRGIDIWWMKGAKVYHQYHPHCMPPLHHLRSILRNADHFADRWGHRTMEHWLYAFQIMGLIEKTECGALRVLREPSEADYALCRQGEDMPYANTRRVLDILQDRAAGAKTNRERTREVAEAQAEMASVAAE